MIIECQACHARFRLDETKIRGKGARVKCRKCGEGIIVLKEGRPGDAPAEPVASGSLDLGSVLRESVGEGPAPAPRPPADNLIPFPGPARPPEPEIPAPGAERSTPGSVREPSPGAAEEKDEVDLAFERFLTGGGEPSFPPASEAEPTSPAFESDAGPRDVEERPAESAPAESAPAEPAGETGGLQTPGPEAAGGGREEPSGPDRWAATLDFAPEEALDLSGGKASETPPGEPASDLGQAGFLISDSETLDFLKEEHRIAESTSDTDISFAISSDPVDMEASTLRMPPASPAPPVETAGAPEEELALEGNATPPPAPPEVVVPPYREEEPAGEISAETPDRTPRREPVPAQASRSRTSPSPARIASTALLALLLAAAGYLGLTPSGRKTAESVAPGLSALWGGKPAAKTASKYDLKNVIGYYESGTASPRILVIKGQVTNLSSVEKNGIRIHAALMDNTDRVLAEQVAYAGNLVSGETLKNGDRESLGKTLANPLGDRLSNMHVPAGKAIPFMVLFFDAPQNIDSYRLEAKDNP